MTNAIRCVGSLASALRHYATVGAVLATSCGGDSKSAACGSGTACGGDIEGIWRVTDVCAHLDPSALGDVERLPSACREGITAAVQNARLSPAGASIEFAGGTYTQRGQMQFETGVFYTRACIDALTGAAASATPCAALESELSRELESAACRTEAGACSCSVSGTAPFDATGSYRTEGEQIFFDGGSESGGFCVRGDTAAVQATSGIARGALTLERTGPASSGDGGASGDGGTSGDGGAFGSGGASGTGGEFGSGGSGGSGGSVMEGTELSRGSSRLIDAFVAESGIFVVLEDAILLIDRQGNEARRVAAPRPAMAAAFDGGLLVVADGAKLTTYGGDLAEIASGNLVEACASGLLLDGGRFVCGPANDWDRIFYTYDARTGSLLATSAPYTYNGIPMRPIPGTNDFVTVTVGSSPSDFHLYTTETSGEVRFVNESPYHGDFPVTDVYAWNAIPATHLVTHTGLLLRIYGPNCASGASVFDSGCFTRDGALGTLTATQRFVAMDTDASGKLHGIVTTTTGFGDACAESCMLQRVDVASRTPEVQKVVRFGAGAFVALRHDARSGSVIAAYHLAGYGRFPGDPYPGHRVASLTED